MPDTRATRLKVTQAAKALQKAKDTKKGEFEIASARATLRRANEEFFAPGEGETFISAERDPKRTKFMDSIKKKFGIK